MRLRLVDVTWCPSCGFAGGGDKPVEEARVVLTQALRESELEVVPSILAR